MAGGKRLTKRQKEYREKLRDPRWQRKRLEVLDAADWRCTWCEAGESDGRNIQIHHGYYARDHEPWEYPNEALFVLCEFCHEHAEALKAELLQGLGLIHPKYHHHVFYGVEGFKQQLDDGQDIEELAPWKPVRRSA